MVLSRTKDKPAGITAGQLGLAVGSYALGSFTAAVTGQVSGIPGVFIGGVGILTKNLYLTSLGAGMYLGAAVKAAEEKGLIGIDEDDLEGLNLETIKGRAKEYFRSLGRKLYLPVDKQESDAGQGTSGLGNVTYFVNPYSQQQDSINLSELDKISAQIAEMSKPVEGVDNFEDRNF
jgi:hypothetical protein